MKRITLYFSLFLMLTISCQKPQLSNTNEHLVMATLYQQTAAEYRALCYQAYNLGKWRLSTMLDTLKSDKKPAIVVDIDETVLDNSPYEAFLIKTNKHYPAGWQDWLAAAEAKPVPGALEFLKWADQKGVDIFYVSNRKEDSKSFTMQNLANLGFPQVEEGHLFLRTTTSSKEERRQAILKTHVILLLFGDNLNDFAQIFEHKSISERFKAVDQVKEEFGRRFIVLPNAMYGEWEGAVYDYQWQAAPEVKRQLRLKALKPFKEQ